MKKFSTFIILLIIVAGIWISYNHPPVVEQAKELSQQLIIRVKKFLNSDGQKAVSEQTGIASWYGNPFHGRQTANGEIYDMNKLTAAHKKLPFNTKVRVTNLTNGKSVIVRINDRGPFVKGRIIDLSRKAARRIDMIGPGTAKVQLDIL